MTTKYKVTKKEFDSAGGISNPHYARIMRNNKWTYWRLT
jgi:hypothetical protein